MGENEMGENEMDDFIKQLNESYEKIEKSSKDANYLLPTESNRKFLQMFSDGAFEDLFKKEDKNNG